MAIVNHGERLKEIANRVPWLEDGRFARQDELVSDPVCGMSLERANAPYSIEVRGDTYWFCCGGCRSEFEETINHAEAR